MAKNEDDLGNIVREDANLRRLSVPPPKRCTASLKRMRPDGKGRARCPNPPMKGQRVCKVHGGNAPNSIKDGMERLSLQKAVKALRNLGEKVQPWERVDPREALLDLVHQSWTLKEALQFLINDMEEGDIAGVGRMTTVDSGVEGVGPIQVPHPGGMMAKIRINMYEAALDRCARISKQALDAGIEERMVKLAEKQSQQIAEVIKASVIDLPPDMQLQVITRAANELRFRSAQPVGQLVGG